MINNDQYISNMNKVLYYLLLLVITDGEYKKWNTNLENLQPLGTKHL